MAKDDIQDANPNEGQAVTSVTTVVPHPADASSQPGPYDGLELNRPPVSTNRPDVPIAHSLVAGAGAPTGAPDYRPDDPNDVPSTAYVTADDKDNVVKVADPAATSSSGSKK